VARRDLRERLSTEAIAHAWRFNWDSSADTILKIIEEVISAR
jgi:hypothetical protein